jgi:hypothetical protein
MKLYLNLCTFKALRPSLSLVIQLPFFPLHRLWYSGGFDFFVSFLLNKLVVGKFCVVVSSLFYSLVVEGK